MACGCTSKCPKCKRDILRTGREIAPLDGRPAIQCSCGYIRLSAVPPTHPKAIWVTKPSSKIGTW